MDIKNRTDKDKQQEYYYLERGKHHVNGCCTFEEGYYCGYHESEAQGFEMGAWASSQTVKRVVRQLVKIKANFRYNVERAKVGDVIDELYSEDAPFEYTYRFPIFKSYLRVSKIAGILDQITGAASHKVERPEDGFEKLDKEAEKKRIQNEYDNQLQFNKGVKNLEEIVSGGTWTYNRYRFENEVKILWCTGPPKCIQPKVQSTCPADDNGYPVCPNPPPCEGTQYTASDLVKLLNDKKPVSRLADRWFVNILDFTNPECFKEKLTKVADISVKIPSIGFAFSPREGSSGDTFVYRVRYNLNSNFVHQDHITCDIDDTD